MPSLCSLPIWERPLTPVPLALAFTLFQITTIHLNMVMDNINMEYETQ